MAVLADRQARLVWVSISNLGLTSIHPLEVAHELQLRLFPSQHVLNPFVVLILVRQGLVTSGSWWQSRPEAFTWT